MKKALGYIRVSTQGQAEEGLSLGNQRERIYSYCEFKGLNITDIVEDAGISGGKNRARAGFMSLLDRLEAGDADVLVLYSLERLSRDMLTLLALEKLLAEHNVELHTVEGLIDTSTPDGFMNFAMKAFMSEMERRRIGQRTKAVMKHKKSKGEVVGQVPYGYRREGDDLVPVLEEQATMKTANAMYAEGKRLVDITNTLNSEGALTRSGRPWNSTQVKRILDGYKATKKNRTKIGDATRIFLERIA